ncbi:MAG: hypothetical protein ACPHAN_08980 [Pseudomonadales bacterium]
MTSLFDNRVSGAENILVGTTAIATEPMLSREGGLIVIIQSFGFPFTAQ